MADKRKTLADYRKEARREPFELPLDDDTVIVIPPPNGYTLMDLDTAYSTRAVLKLLAGGQYEALIGAIGDEDGAVLMAIGKDIRDHFGLGGFNASPA
jgi:hypothetical protein